MFNKKNTKVILGIAILILALLLINVFWSKKADKDESSEITATEDLSRTINSELNTPENLVEFLNTFKIRERDSLVAYTPEEFYQKEKGATHDFAVFVAHVLKENNFETGVIRYNYRIDGKEKTHTVAVFRDVDTPKYITVTDKGIEMLPYGWSFSDLIKAEEERLGADIYQYTFFPVGVTDLTKPAEGYDWQEVK
jgi:hypothetical protein